MELKLLFVDDGDVRNDLAEFFNAEDIEGYIIKTDVAETFEKGIEKIKTEHFDIIILDLCQGEPSDNAEKAGLDVLNAIQGHSFIPVIFFTGIAHSIVDLNSEVVSVVNKHDGFETLKSEVKRIISSNIALLKHKIHGHIESEMQKYFWDIVHAKRNLFKQNESEFSLGYLLLRRLAHSLSKENIKQLLGDGNIKTEKTHPMEFYIFPSHEEEEYEAGEILIRDDVYYTVLTPSCDFIEDKASKRERRVGQVLLAIAEPLVNSDYYKDYKKTSNKDNRARLEKIIETRKGDQFFFLPGTPFIENLILDFQKKIMVSYRDLKNFTRVAKLDDPFAQSMISSFVRYYNRIGFPDIDADYVISKL